ncbi:hypothetical protein C4H11_12970 [Bacteroides zoogleoformans]|uniref:Uncharacterized protein n=1 Tax=Bacteroides zoogleoformans TaxID=28119 RepID=A0ABM6TAD0_9BACE|nr:hypothetical protein C4H11_12970 [Bacteroides zoogleoformans]
MTVFDIETFTKLYFSFKKSKEIAYKIAFFFEIIFPKGDFLLVMQFAVLLFEIRQFHSKHKREAVCP